MSKENQAEKKQVLRTVAREVAEKEFNDWLDRKRVKAKRREDKKPFGEIIIDNITDGSVVFNDDGNLVYSLIFPIEDDKGNVVVDKFTFQSRIQTFDLKSNLKKYPSDDGDGRITAYAASLTKQATGMIEKVDTEDRECIAAISMYFL